MKKYILILITFTLLYISCVDEVRLDLPKGLEKIVVFGWITDEVRSYEVTISKTNSFLNRDPYPVVSGAEVYVVDELGNKFIFTESLIKGSYRSDLWLFQAIPSIRYQLHINTPTDTLMSDWEELPLLSVINQAFINFVTDPNKFEIEPNDDNYFISGFVDDTSPQISYYRWKVTIDGDVRNNPAELILFNDQFTNGNRFRYDAKSVLFPAGKIVSFQHLSISKKAFNYFVRLRDQSKDSALTPRSLPSILNGNIRNINDTTQIVLGYFGASQVQDILVVQ